MMTDDEILAGLAIHYPPPLSPAERTRQWREHMKLAGRPDTKVTMAAIVEAQSYLMSLATTMPVTVDAVDLVKVSVIVLVRQGYDREHAKAGVLERLARRPHHDGTAAMPSRQLTANTQVIEPPRAGEWDPRDIELIRKLTAKSVVAPPLHPQTG